MSNLVEERLKLHTILTDIMKKYSSDARVFFKPDSNVKLKYPCIIYTREGDQSRHADNVRYFNNTEFQITVIDRDSDSEVVNDILNTLVSARRSNEFVSNGLYHYIITISNGVITNG